MTDAPEDRLRALVRTALTDAHISQAEAARQLGLSAKHMSQMLTGRSARSLTWAEGLLGLCGRSLVIEARSDDRSSRDQAQPRRLLRRD